MNRDSASLLLAFICCCCIGCFGQRRDCESELIQYLQGVSNYSALTRPILAEDTPVSVSIDFCLSQLLSVDSAKQSVTISAFMQASWPEERLVWDPASFGNVSVVNWDSSQVWFPVILLYNGIGDNQALAAQLPVYLTSNGPNRTTVSAGWRREFEFSCAFDMSVFPVDKQKCELEFFFSDQGHGNKLVVPVKNLGVSALSTTGLYKENSEWKLVNMTTFSEMKPYNLLQGMAAIPLPTYVIHLEIERVSIYYFMIVIVPLLLLTLLQVLVFFLPLECEEKLGFGITIMLSYTVFLLLLDGILPKSQSMPAIASFITAAMVLSTISLLLTSVVMRFHFTPEGTRMPACARAVFVRCLGRLFCVGGPAPPDGSGTSVRKTGDGAQEAVRSDWHLAANAIERLLEVMGIIAIAVIIAVFVINPYV